MTTQIVDLAIIGSGGGNSIPDERFDDKSIAIFEEGVYGGTCLNVGCIPTKMFVYSAEVADTVREAESYGVHARVDAVDWPSIVKRIFGRIDPISAGGKEYRVDRCPNITVYPSHVEFDGRDEAGRYRLVTTDAEVRAREVVLAAGSRATVPSVIADSAVRYYTNDDVMRLEALPEHLIIVGSGYIAAEFAHVFGSLGSRVSILARGPALLRQLERDVSLHFTDIAREKWDVHLNAEVIGAEDRSDGGVRVSLKDGTHVDGDVLLVATGRWPNGDRLNLSSVGIDLDDEGRVVCDRHGRTSAERVWTFGDVSSPYQLKHVANHEGRVVQANLLKGWDAADLDAFDHRFVPAAVFTHPQIACVGLTEEEALERGLDITVKIQDYGDVAYGWAMEDTTGFCKLIAERRSGRLLGCHILGPQAPTVIQPVIQAMSFGLDARAMARGQFWIHPAMPEVLENALLGLHI
ncbi:mycothione reductase [Gordonia rhizosphera]|uniref:Mycothione reductase n=1 Tax=Gordonia rhizosphera NBRC 16068 TaxID=1108045 RepID=K6VPM7_9ACTN|nr:mycothione reductase [Gordonia rhizosphera]GAB88825.1 mycothione reductase [Gordonia rhizosphera NBRC 16068]